MKGCFVLRRCPSGVSIGTSEVSSILNVTGLFAHECCNWQDAEGVIKTPHFLFLFLMFYQFQILSALF